MRRFARTAIAPALASLTMLAGCEIVSGLDDIQVREPPAATNEGGADVANRDAPFPDTSSPDVGNLDVSNPPGDGEVDTPSERVDLPDARPTDARSEGSSDAPSSDVRDGACIPADATLGRAGDLVSLGGSFTMGTTDAAGEFANARPPHSARVDPFSLDKFEVSVARFRKFVESYTCWRETHPVKTDGTVAGDPRGWVEGWTGQLLDETELRATLEDCGAVASTKKTWSQTPGSSTSENLPINCVTWFEALAFCIWDGGRLPTEAEWEFAAGGAKQQSYPTGPTDPFPGEVNFGLPGGGPIAVDAGSPFEAFGTRNMAGNVAEWVFDSELGQLVDCTSTASCLVLTNDLARGVRGGAWTDPLIDIRTARRTFRDPKRRSEHVGFRCARNGKLDGV